MVAFRRSSAPADAPSVAVPAPGGPVVLHPRFTGEQLGAVAPPSRKRGRWRGAKRRDGGGVGRGRT